MKLLNVILFIFGACCSSLVLADEMGPDAKSFESILAQPYETTQIYARDQSSRLPRDIYQKLTSVAFEQAQVWADTILEGDYRAAGGTRLDQVDALQRNGMVVGYRIIYSEQAWELGTCGYYRSDEAHKPEALKACPEGRIYEASFVSPAFTTFIRDQGRYAQFQLAE